MSRHDWPDAREPDSVQSIRSGIQSQTPKQYFLFMPGLPEFTAASRPAMKQRYVGKLKLGGYKF